MKAKELAEELLKHPDFEVEFSFFDANTAHFRNFEGVVVGDIGHSDKVIILGGIEDF